MNTVIYNESFHKDRDIITSYSANKVINILMEKLDISSMCDVGGGIGTWIKEYLKICEENKFFVEKAVCLDGDYIKKICS